MALRASGTRAAIAAASLLAMVALAAPAGAAPAKGPGRAGALTQLSGKQGCLVDPSARNKAGCGIARALAGAGPFMGSRAIAVSPDGRNVYVAASKSNAVAVFSRDKSTGALRQLPGKAGCVAAKGGSGCTAAIGLAGPNSVALSPDGRNLYVTSRLANSVVAFKRNASTGALRPIPGGCVAGIPLIGCVNGVALVGPDVVVASGDGRNVYVGSFFGNAVASFARDTASGALTQLPGSAACVAEAIAGCAPARALGSPEGMAMGPGGASVIVAAALSNSVAVLGRDTTSGALAQAGDESGCFVETPLPGCATGVQLAGANAVATSPGGGNAYVTTLLSNGIASFNASPAGLTQKRHTFGCLVNLRAAGCSFGRSMKAPEGIAVAPGGASAYVAAFGTGAIDVLSRDEHGIIAQMPGPAGCMAPPSVPDCRPGRALKGVSSIAVSPDGRNVYSTAFGSNAVDVFRRNR
jgi:DNA-binding beta-propeller fold protein YncE